MKTKNNQITNKNDLFEKYLTTKQNDKSKSISEWWEYILLLTDYNNNINSKEIKWKKLDLK